MIITLGHAKGGVAKTTLALNIAPRIKPEILIDQDQHMGISILNCMRQEKYDRYNVLCDHTDNQLVDACRKTKGHVLIDCGGFDSDSNRKAVALSDLLIIPCSPDATEKIGMMNFNQTLKEINEHYQVKVNAKILITKFHPNKKDFSRAMDLFEKMDQATLLNTKIPYLAEIPSMMEWGLGVLEHKQTKYSKAANLINKLCDELGL